MKGEKETVFGGTNWSQPPLTGTEIAPSNRIKLASKDCWVSRRFALRRDRSKAVKQEYERNDRGGPLTSYPRVYHLSGLDQGRIEGMVRFLAEQQIDYEIL